MTEQEELREVESEEKNPHTPNERLHLLYAHAYKIQREIYKKATEKKREKYADLIRNECSIDLILDYIEQEQVPLSVFYRAPKILEECRKNISMLKKNVISSLLPKKLRFIAGQCDLAILNQKIAKKRYNEFMKLYNDDMEEFKESQSQLEWLLKSDDISLHKEYYIQMQKISSNKLLYVKDHQIYADCLTLWNTIVNGIPKEFRFFNYLYKNKNVDIMHIDNCLKEYLLENIRTNPNIDYEPLIKEAIKNIDGCLNAIGINYRNENMGEFYKEEIIRAATRLDINPFDSIITDDLDHLLISPDDIPEELRLMFGFILPDIFDNKEIELIAQHNEYCFEEKKREHVELVNNTQEIIEAYE